MPSQQYTKDEKADENLENSHRKKSALDGGWGWVVCFAGACCNFTVTGLCSSSGLFLLGLKRIFDEPVSKLVIIVTLIDGFSMMAAPLGSLLLVHFSHRTVMMLSGVLGSIGALVGAFSTSSDMMIVTYGLISGASIGISFFTCQVITAKYFDKKRALAIAINNCGGGLGTMILTIFIGYLIELYGLRGTMLIISGLILNILVYGSLCRPLPPYYTNQGIVKEKDVNEDSKMTRKFSRTSSTSKQVVNEAFEDCEVKEDTGKGTYVDQAFANATISNVISKCSSLAQNGDKSCGNLKGRCFSIEGAELFRNTNFVLLILSYVMCVCTIGSLPYISPLCVWYFKMSQNSSAVIMAIVGLFTTIGELVIGVLVDLLHIGSRKIFAFSLLGICLSAALMPFCYTFELMAPVASLFGLMGGFSVSLRLILITEVVGLNLSTKAFSMLSFFCGLGFFASPPIYGVLYDTTGSFFPIFFSASGSALAALIFLILITLRNRHTQ